MQGGGGAVVVRGGGGVRTGHGPGRDARVGRVQLGGTGPGAFGVEESERAEVRVGLGRGEGRLRDLPGAQIPGGEVLPQAHGRAVQEPGRAGGGGGAVVVGGGCGVGGLHAAEPNGRGPGHGRRGLPGTSGRVATLKP